MIRKDETLAEAWARRDRQREARAHRTCPVPFDRAPMGFCRWCGEAIDGKRQRRWHPWCKFIYRLHSDAATQFRFLVQRDGETCACGCGRAPIKVVRGFETKSDGYRCTRVYFNSALEIEHVEPLWKVRTILDRIAFYGPGNLQLLAPDPCHKSKSARESAERAHFDALEKRRKAADQAVEPKKKWGSRPLQSQGFQPGHRPLRSRNDLRKRP